MRNQNWVQFLIVWRTKVEPIFLKIVGSSFNLGLGIFIRGWKWQLVVEAWSFSFLFLSFFFHWMLLLATSLPLFSWSFCHINVRDVFLLVVTHIGGCGVLLVIATHHCWATPSPSWSYHLVIVVAMVIMVFSLLQSITTHYCPHHFTINNYTLLSSS
jgi:hypothetical protein